MKYSFLKFVVFTLVFVTAGRVWANPLEIDVTLLSGDGCSEELGYDCSLQEALTVAQDLPNVEIHLDDGSYNADSSFTYAPNDSSYVLSLVGAGYDVVSVSSASGPAMELTVGASLQISGIQFFNSESGLVISDTEDSVFDVTIEDCAFVSNGSGGLVIENDDAAGELQISDSLFTTNANNTHGGGLAVTSSQALPVTLTNNTFSDNNIAAGNGGGAYIYGTGDNSPFTATGNTFDLNATSDGTGGNLYVQEDGSDSPIVFGGSSSADGNTVQNGYSTVEGGGIWLRSTGFSDDSYIECSHNTLSGNESATAGGFMLDTDGGGDVHISFVNNTVTDNFANDSGGGYLYAADGLVFENNQFSSNTAATNAAVWIGIDGVANTADNAISHNTFRSNVATAGSGAGLFVWVSNDHEHGTLTLDGNFFTGNSAESGAVNEIDLNSVLDSAMVIRNNVIVNNTSTGSGGGLYIKSGAVAATVNFVNNTVSGNTAESGGGIYFDPNSFTANFYNNIIFGNTASSVGDDVYVSVNNFNVFNFNNNDFGEICVSNGEDHCNDGLDFSLITVYNGNFLPSDNLLDDPLFRGSANFKLTADSPAIGAGDTDAPSLPSEDFNGVALASPPDLGAYQFVPSVPAPIVSLSDANLDFGEQVVGSDSDAQTVTVTNTGDATLTITDISVSGDFAVTDTCDDTLAPDASCEISVVFSPTAEGDAAESLTVETDSGSSPDSAALTGTGTHETGVTGDDDTESAGNCALNSQAKASSSRSLVFCFVATFLGLARLRYKRRAAVFYH